MEESKFEFTVSEDAEGERIDSLIHELVPEFSRSYIQKIINQKLVFKNGKNIKPSNAVSEGDSIIMYVPEAIRPDIEPQNIPLDILYEDNDVLVVNKPKNMVVHPAPGHYSDTLVNAVMYHCHDNLSGINGILRPGIVHRIDKDTTGSIIICKNDHSHRIIAAQLKDHSIKREYCALVNGIIDDDEGIINAPIGRSRKDRKKMTIDNVNGKRAVTHYYVLKRFPEDKVTYVKCILETGRTHQIRVHMTSIGHPLLGDEVYNTGYQSGRNMKWKLDGQCLHARVLGFIHPTTGQYIETIAPMPEYFEHMLEILK